MKIRCKNLQHFNLKHAHKPNFWLMLKGGGGGLPVPNFFLALLLSFLSEVLLSLPFSLHFLSGCCKKLGVNYGQSLEMGRWSIIGKNWALLPPFFQQNWYRWFSIGYVRMPSISKTDRCADRSVQAQLYQVNIKVAWSRHKWYKEHDSGRTVFTRISAAALV